jgi:predicted nucleic acid-binding protein
VTPVFVDTGGFFAALVAEDAHHAHAAHLFARSKREAWRLVTTNAVVYETHALLVNRVRNGRDVALAFLAAIDAGLAVAERVRVEDDRSAVKILRAHTDKGYSFCDTLSFAVMERLGIERAIAFDRHFHDYGRFTIL